MIKNYEKMWVELEEQIRSSMPQGLPEGMSPSTYGKLLAYEDVLEFMQTKEEEVSSEV